MQTNTTSTAETNHVDEDPLGDAVPIPVSEDGDDLYHDSIPFRMYRGYIGALKDVNCNFQ
jgi:hypothetical protein